MSSPSDAPPIADMCAIPVKGYPRIAHFMGKFPELGFVRTFSAIGMRRILYLQAELTHLSEELREIEVADASSCDQARKEHATDWLQLKISADNAKNADNVEDVENKECRQWNKLKEIFPRYDEYCKAVLTQYKMALLPRGNEYDRNKLREWLEEPEKGGDTLTGLDRFTWGSLAEPRDPAPDLAAIKRRAHETRLAGWLTSGFLSSNLPPFLEKVSKKFDNLMGRQEQSRVSSSEDVYSETKLLEFASHFTTAIASIFPLTSIIILYCVHDMKARLAIIAFFSFLFSWALLYCTGGKLIEVFSATAAFCAVQVVFVGTN